MRKSKNRVVRCISASMLLSEVSHLSLYFTVSSMGLFILVKFLMREKQTGNFRAIIAKNHRFSGESHVYGHLNRRSGIHLFHNVP